MACARAAIPEPTSSRPRSPPPKRSALVVGYEAVSRLGAASPASIVQRGFRPVGIMGPIGAAAAAATVLGADAGQLASALAIAVNLSGGSTQGIFEGTMEPYLQAGMGARNGLFAARLALASAVTSKAALEGGYGFFKTYGGSPGDVDRLLGPTARHGICGVGTKRFAACLQNQQTVALIVDGLDAPLFADEIERIVVTRPDAGTNGLNSPGVSRSLPFDNMLSAQMSARFTAAAAILGHPVEDPRFFQARHGDREIWALTQRIDLVSGTGQDVSVVVVRRNGPDIRLDADKSDMLFPPGEGIRATFLDRAERILGDGARLAADRVDRLEALDDVRALTDALVPKRGPGEVP